MTPPIVQAARIHDLKEVRKLIHEGCDINERDSNGWSALFMAVATGDAEIAELLIMNGADINQRANSGRTPLSKAATQEDDRLIRILLNNRAELNLQCNSGNTALHYAACMRMPISVEILLKAKADVTIKNIKRIRPTQYKRVLPPDHDSIMCLFEKADLEFEIEEPNSGILFENPMKK